MNVAAAVYGSPSIGTGSIDPIWETAPHILTERWKIFGGATPAYKN